MTYPLNTACHELRAYNVFTPYSISSNTYPENTCWKAAPWDPCRVTSNNGVMGARCTSRRNSGCNTSYLGNGYLIPSTFSKAAGGTTTTHAHTIQ